MSIILLFACSVSAQPPASPLTGWNFKFKDFPIGAWLGPDGNESEVKVYKEAGFNLVMVGRYMEHGQYAVQERIPRELDLARQYGLYAMLDTYTENDKPWGGAVPATTVPGHHSASLEELEWIHKRFGSHPALAGYLLGDDQTEMSPQLAEATRFLRENAPHLFPWVCGGVPAGQLAAHGNPFVNWQIYPTLYKPDAPAEAQAQEYCREFDRMRVDCLKTGCVSWPMINADGPAVNDSLLQFPAYAALAYGAQGLWYFTYRHALTNGKESQPGHNTYREAVLDVKPLWRTARRINRHLTAFGPKLLGYRAAAPFSTGWQIPGAVDPQLGRTIETMSDDLLVGILTKPGQPPMAVAVDKRVVKSPDAPPPRSIQIAFTRAVEQIDVLDDTGIAPIKGNIANFSLGGGEGALLVLHTKPAAVAFPNP